jgi:sugar/nucleoside kinase (ribokinase family)
MKSIPVDDKVWIDSKKTYVGGQGANAAQDMALLGLNVSFLTRLGNDSDGKNAIEHYKGLGMDTRHCIIVPGAQTMSACVAISIEAETRACLMQKDENMFKYNIDADLAAIDLSSFDAVYTDGHQLDMALPVVKRAVDHNVPVLADVEVLDDEARVLADIATDLVAPLSVILTLAGTDDPGHAVLKLANIRPGRIVIGTAGKDGAYGASSGDARHLHVPAKNCSTVDTVGAGDAFHAGFQAAKVDGKDLAEMMELASRVAAASVESSGPVVSKEALERWLPV